jgi:HK97 family phage major capsid protein
MDKITYLKFLRDMNPAQLKDYLEAVWREDIIINEAYELWMEEYLREVKIRKIAVYASIFLLLLALLAAVPEYDGPIKRLSEKLGPPEVPQDYDLMWITELDEKVCPICAPLHGLIISENLVLLGIKTHPGCRCKIVEIKKGQRAMKIRTLQAGAVRAIENDGVRQLEVLAAPFGSPKRKDKLGQFLSARTDFMLEVGDRRPLLYMHGFSPRGRAMNQPMSIGVARATRVDHDGLWMLSDLDNSELSDRTWKAALEGNARASTGSVNYLERHDEVTGEVLCWPIAELSVFDAGEDRVPVSDDAIVLPLRSLFDEHKIDLPDNFEAGEDKKDEVVKPTTRTMENKMTNEVEKAVAEALAKRDAEEKAKAALRAEIKAEIEAEMKEKPKYRETFNIGGNESKSKAAMRITQEEKELGWDVADKEEAEAYIWNLMHPTQAPKAMRVLEESQALEGASLIPTPLLNKIIGLKDEYSLVSKLGIQKYYTDSLTLTVPRENAGMGVFATIAEEGAYIANEPAFEGTTCTVVKKGSMITATEEMLEDSSIFEPYFVQLCARKWGLTENLELFTKLKATDTIGLASATFTQAEIDAWMFAMTEPWADGNVSIIMAQATMGTIRGLLIGTPRAYGDFPSFGGKSHSELFGFPTYLNSNWEAVGAGATTLTMSMVNPDALAYVERRGMSIKVDPYGDALNGRVRFFPSYRAVCEVIQILGHVSYLDA